VVKQTTGRRRRYHLDAVSSARLLNFAVIIDIIIGYGLYPQRCGAGSVKRYGVRPSVRLSVPAWTHSSKPAAAGLLLWARQAGNIDRLLQQRRATGECGQCHVVSVR